MKNKIIILFILCVNNLLISQTRNIDLLTVEGIVASPQKYDSLYNGTASEKNFRANLTFPIVFSDTNIWYNEINYDKFQVYSSSNQIPNSVQNPIRLHTISYRTGIIHQFSATHKIYFFVEPSLLSDVKKIGKNNVQLGCVALLEKRYRDDFTMRGGFLVNQDYTGAFFTPLIYIDRVYSNKLSLTAMIPQYFKVFYQLKPKVILGFRQFASARIYHLTNNDYKGNYMYRKSIDLALFTRYKLIGGLMAEVRAGYSFQREYNQYAGNDKLDLIRLPGIELNDKRTLLNSSFKDGTFITFGIVYNYSLQ